MKTLNLTWIRAQNNPINRRIQGFSSRTFENKVRHSRCDFSQFPRSILDFKHSLDAEMRLEDEEFKRFSYSGV